MPPFTFNLRKNGNFFRKFPFLLSSCRHFVDSLRESLPYEVSPSRGSFFSLPGEKRENSGIRKKKVVFRPITWYNERAFVQKKE